MGITVPWARAALEPQEGAFVPVAALQHDLAVDVDGFHRLSTSLKMDGCSSHSGRRTFMTRAARQVSQVGGSLRDVQELAGHTSLATTQRSIEGDTETKRKLVALL